LGTMLHEWMHSWYQQLMATNESLYSWMDEGFTTYAESRTSQWLRKKPAFAQEGSYRSYVNLATSHREEPLTTHADHYNTNFAYSANAYSKGAVFLTQLGYIISDSLLDKTLLEYYRLWKFKHPNPNDFIRVAEKTSGIHLQWYLQDWVNTTKTIDYKIDSLWSEGGQTLVRVKRLGDIAMPVDVELTFKDGSKELHYVPLATMYNTKPAENNTPRKVYEPNRWTHREIVISTSKPLNEITLVEIDPSLRLADIDRKNNKLELKW
jgi:aminopeptidase N